MWASAMSSAPAQTDNAALDALSDDDAASPPVAPALFETYEHEYCELAHVIKQKIKKLQSDLAQGSASGRDAADEDDDIELGYVASSTSKSQSSSSVDDWKQQILKLEKQLSMANNIVKNMEMELHASSASASSAEEQGQEYRNAMQRLKQYKRDLVDMKSRFEQSQRQVLLALEQQYGQDDYDDDDDDLYADMNEYGKSSSKSSAAAMRGRMAENTSLLQESGRTLENILRVANQTEAQAADTLGVLGTQRESINRSLNKVRY